jgi:predicted component of type VI protein secretion system
VSGQHALISFRSGVFYIQDMSRNGVSVNSPENRLMRNRPYALKPGDRIFIEPYEIEVWIDAGSARSTRQPQADPFADDPFAPRHDVLLPDQNLGPVPASPVNDDVDPLKFFDPVAARPPRKSEPVVPAVDDFLGQHYQPPAIVPSPPTPSKPTPFEPIAIPAGYDPLSPDDSLAPPSPPPPPVVIRPRPGDSSIEARRRSKDVSSEESTVRQPAVPAVTPVPASVESAARPAPAAPPPPDPAARRVDAAPRPASHSADLAELMSGAGVPDAVITPELSRNLGQIIRTFFSHGSESRRSLASSTRCSGQSTTTR